jgi:hypothetical protein
MLRGLNMPVQEIVPQNTVLNPLPALTLQSARDLNVPYRQKRSKALLLTQKNRIFFKKKMYLHFEQKHLTFCRSN